MAPRSAKTKKMADAKVAQNEAPKKGRGKTKNVEEQLIEATESEINEKVAPVAEKKGKRGKKYVNEPNEQEPTNGTVEETVLPAKKGKKKNVSDPSLEENPTNGDNLIEEESSVPAEEDEQNSEHTDTNGHSEEIKIGRGRKKQTKKEVTEKASGFETKPKESGRGKRNVKQDNTDSGAPDDEDAIEEKPKSAGKGRGRKAQQKVEKEDESEDKTEATEEVKAEPVSKGRKKGQSKTAKVKTMESEKEESLEGQKELEDDKLIEESKKKDTKGRKNQGKKAQAKENVEENDEEFKEEEPASKKRKVVKKDVKGKNESNDEEIQEDEVPEVKPARGKRGNKKIVEALQEPEDEPQDTGEPTTKRRRKQAEEKAFTDDSKKKAPLKNKATTNYDEIDFSNLSKNAKGKDWNFKIASWNVDGIRAWLGKGGLDYIKYEKPDILCLQEIKCSKDKLPDDIANLPGYHAYWLCSDVDGYAGVGIYTTKLAINVQYGLENEDLDAEGRIITAEYEQFYLICTYVPNAGRKLVTLPKRLHWNEEFRKYVKELDKKKPVIICGDMNVSHNEIDLANPKTNRKNAGFTDEERSGMTELLGDGFVDTFRHLNPDKTGAYTFWTYMMNSRAKNVGWRLDYFIVSQRLLPAICDSVIRDRVYGSDHCPISLFLHLSSADKPKE